MADGEEVVDFGGRAREHQLHGRVHLSAHAQKVKTVLGQIQSITSLGIDRVEGSVTRDGADMDGVQEFEPIQDFPARAKGLDAIGWLLGVYEGEIAKVCAASKPRLGSESFILWGSEQLLFAATEHGAKMGTNVAICVGAFAGE